MKKNAQYVGVDEKYIPEDEKYVDNSTNSEIKDTVDKGIQAVNDYVSNKDNQEKIKKTGKKGLKIIKGIGIGYLIFFCFTIVTIIIIFIMVFNSFFKFNKKFDKIENKTDEIINKTESNIDLDDLSYDVFSFNNNLEIYNGSKYGSQISSLLTSIVTLIKKNSNHSISVVYKDITTSNADEMIKMKNNFDDWTKYEVSFDYDTDGFINRVTIIDE